MHSGIKPAKKAPPMTRKATQMTNLVKFLVGPELAIEKTKKRMETISHNLESHD
jgi:hypothetical protein